MTIWQARRSKDRVLCGWTVAGRATCPGLIARITDLGWGPMVYFEPFYRPARPKHPDEPLELVIGKHASAALDRGQEPLGRRLQKTRDGVKVVVPRAWGLPVIAPCPRRGCGRQNLVADQVLDRGVPAG